MARQRKRGRRRKNEAQRASAEAMVPAGDFEAFYRRHLAPAIADLETERKAVALRVWAWLLLIVPAGTALTGYSLTIGGGGYFFSIALGATVAGVLAVLGLFRIRYDADFNARIIRPIIGFYDPDLDYEPGACVPRSLFADSRLFPGTPPERYRGEDLVSGTLGKTRMCFSEVTAERVTRVRTRDGSTRESVTTLFRGVFFSADFNKRFSGATYVLPDRAQKLLGSIGQFLQSRESAYGQLVKLEDPEFERAFVVYSDNQIEARYILTPALMQRILDFHRRSKRKLRISFAGSNVNVAIDIGRNLFAPRLFRTLLDPSLYETYWNDLKLLAGIVEELNLNTRIWTKA